MPYFDPRTFITTHTIHLLCQFPLTNTLVLPFLFAGSTFQKAGVNVSVVHGVLPPEAMKQMKSRGKDLPDESVKFFATGEFSLFDVNSSVAFLIFGCTVCHYQEQWCDLIHLTPCPTLFNEHELEICFEIPFNAQLS